MSLDLDRLDRTVDRYQLLLIAKRVGKEGGFTPRMLQLLDYYMAYTTAKDWEEGSRPIVFQSLARTAMDLGVGERQIQKLEKRLFEIGAICWNDSGNHKRFGRRDPKTGRLVFAYGVDLTPLAYLQEELEAKLHEKLLYAEAWRATKREISQHRRQVRELLGSLREEGAAADVLDRFEAAYREIAIELRSYIDLASLRTLAKRHVELQAQLQELAARSAISEATHRPASLPIAPTTRKGSCRRAEKFAHQEHTTPSNKTKHAEDNSTVLPGEAKEAIGRITPQKVVKGSTDAFRSHLPASDRPLKWSDVIEAAYRRRAELRISQQCWSDSCGSFGRVGTAVGLVITDQAATKSLGAVRFPAAYFRGVTQRLQDFES